MSSLTQLQTIIRNVHGINCPEWISDSGQHGFTEEGTPEQARVKERTHTTLNYFISLAEKLAV